MNIKTMRRGQIWLYNADPIMGDEIGKTRPAIIVNNDEIGILRLKIIVPITGWSDVKNVITFFVTPMTSIEQCLIVPISLQ